MIQLISVTLEDKNLIESWFDNDVAGKKELSLYRDFSSWIKLLTLPNRWGWLVQEAGNKIGFIDLEKDQDNVGHFSFYLAPLERNKGKSKKVLHALIQKAQELGFSSLEAGVSKNNVPSKKSLESVGFAPKGIDNDGYLIYSHLTHSK
jgi:RimJ/RimL family protein N-acetyltransferase